MAFCETFGSHAARTENRHVSLCAAGGSHCRRDQSGHPDAWSCWLTRRLALAVLERATDYIANTSNLAQRAPAELRGEAIAFEREAAIAKTAPAMSQTSPEILKSSTAAAELADRLTISREQDAIPPEQRGESGNGATGVVKREELQRILQMLHSVVAQAGWLAAPGSPRPAAAAVPGDPKPARH